MSLPSLPGRLLIAYALPGLVLAIPTIPVYIHLPAFYADEVGLGLAVTGFVLMAARGFDTVTDPLIGWLSDRLSTRWGRRKPWIAGGGLVAGLALLKLTLPPDGAGAAYLLLWTLILYAGWTCVAVPYMAWGAELADDYHGRTRITAAREGAALVGLVIAAALPAAVAWFDPVSLPAGGLIAVVTVAAGLPVVAVALWWVPDKAAAKTMSATSPGAWRGGIGMLIGNRPFLRLCAAWFANGLANGMPAALFLLFLEHRMGVTEAGSGPFILVYFGAAIVAVPGWLHLSRSIGKHRAWCAAMALASAAFVAVPWMGPAEANVFLVVCALTGAALGADFALPPAMQADVVDLDTLRSGQHRAGLFFALWNMATKLALALAVGIAFTALDRLGFDPRLGEDQDTTALAVIYAGLPVVFKMIAVAMIWGHAITPRRHEIIRRRLATIRPIASRPMETR